MSYSEPLAARIRQVLAGVSGVTEKKMFGGLAFLRDGSMFCGITQEDLMVRVGPDLHEQALAEPHVRPMDFTGRPMKGYVYVDPEGYRSNRQLEKWVRRGADFVATLPAKKPAARKKAASRRQRSRAS
jgi:TfoX/Sxy family transcriptional regulator of competence genes